MILKSPTITGLLSIYPLMCISICLIYGEVLLCWLHAKVKAAQSCLALCDPMDCSHQAPLSMGILQARMLEWVALPSSRGSSQPRDRTCVSCDSYIAGEFFTTEPQGKAQGSHKETQSSYLPWYPSAAFHEKFSQRLWDRATVWLNWEGLYKVNRNTILLCLG